MIFNCFNTAFNKNNIHGLINLSETFYINCIEFIEGSNYLLQDREQAISAEQAKLISTQIDSLTIYIQNLKKSRNTYCLNKKQLILDLSLSDACIEGGEKFDLLINELIALSKQYVIKSMPASRRRCS